VLWEPSVSLSFLHHPANEEDPPPFSSHEDENSALQSLSSLLLQIKLVTRRFELIRHFFPVS